MVQKCVARIRLNELNYVNEGRWGERERETTFLSPGSTFLTSLASFDVFSSLAVNIFQSLVLSSYFHVAAGTKLHSLSGLHEHNL